MLSSITGVAPVEYVEHHQWSTSARGGTYQSARRSSVDRR